jgi:hypothetical protein
MWRATGRRTRRWLSVPPPRQRGGGGGRAGLDLVGCFCRGWGRVGVFSRWFGDLIGFTC